MKLLASKRRILKGNSDIGPDLAILRVVLEPYHFLPPLDSGEHFQGSRRVLAFRQVEGLGCTNTQVFPLLEELNYQLNSWVSISITVIACTKPGRDHRFGLFALDRVRIPEIFHERDKFFQGCRHDALLVSLLHLVCRSCGSRWQDRLT